jgi:ribosomal-protein-alanine N-acetyltransferase
LVAELGGKVVGYVIGVIRWGTEGHVLAVAVDPFYRRKGIGSALMLNVMDRLRQRGAKHVKLEVRKSNRVGQQFYQRLGFKRRDEIPFYYEDGETAVIMTYVF